MEGAFSGCINLKRIEISQPSSLRKINSWAFQYCKELREIVIPPKAAIGADAFAGCAALADEDGFLILGGYLYGYFGESVLITNYILSFIKDDIENIEVPEDSYFTLKDFSKALEFTLISEGFQNNENLYADSIILKVRLNSIITSKVGGYFEGNKYTPVTELMKINNKKAQIININLEDIDDVYAKVIVKIFSRILFEHSKARKDRAQDPYHLFLEEAHRYIQKDSDTFLIGYNIFDRIAKEGRKYGVILDIISQRPVEISDTVIAQCSNFLIFKMTHPLDIKYIEEMLPNISSDVIAKQKVLQPGSCVGFGAAFKIPMIIKMDMPNPSPASSSCDVSSCWSNTTSIENSNPISQNNIFNTEGIVPTN